MKLSTKRRSSKKSTKKRRSTSKKTAKKRRSTSKKSTKKRRSASKKSTKRRSVKKSTKKRSSKKTNRDSSIIFSEYFRSFKNDLNITEIFLGDMPGKLNLDRNNEDEYEKELEELLDVKGGRYSIPAYYKMIETIIILIKLDKNKKKEILNEINKKGNGGLILPKSLREFVSLTFIIPLLESNPKNKILKLCFADQINTKL